MGHHHQNGERPIIARFTRFCDREADIQNFSTLRGKRVYTNEDLCPASQEIRKAQLPRLKQAKGEGKIAYFRHTKLIIKERYANSATSEPEPTTTRNTSEALGKLPLSLPV